MMMATSKKFSAEPVYRVANVYSPPQLAAGLIG